MNRIFIICIVGILLFFQSFALAQRSEVVELAYNVASLASDATTYARRAYNASDFDQLRHYIRKAKLAAEEAESIASNAASLADDYNCEDAATYLREAESYANQAVTYARRAFNADTFADAEYYARKVKRAAEDAETEATNATSECDDN